jgi:hypothetical protein
LEELLVWLTSTNSQLIRFEDMTVLPGNQQFVLTPRKDAVGESTITMKVNDGFAEVTMSFKLTVTNTPPVAHDDSFERDTGTISIELAELLGNDTDPDGDTLKVATVSASENGRSVQLTTNSVVYLGSHEPGEDLFTYEIEDASGARSTATVRLILIAQPKVESISREGADVRIQVSGPPNRDFWLLSSLDGRNWVQVQPGITDTTGRAELIHSGGAETQHHRFYRALWP